MAEFSVRQGEGVTALQVSSCPKRRFRAQEASVIHLLLILLQPPGDVMTSGLGSPSAGTSGEGRTGPLPWWVSNRLP